MTQLLQDVFIVENLQVLTEGKSNDTMKIKGVFGRCNEKNNNGRIYPTNVLEGQLQKVQPLISERRLCGELDHPQNDTVKLSNASHLITKLEMKGNELIGEAEILKTPAGLTAKALVEGGVKIGISSRGMGTLSEDAKGNKIVNEDFRLVTFDLVADPSTRGAFPGLSESTESQFARESQSKLQKESNFVTMLQSKLREAYDPWIEEAKTKKKKGGFPDLNKDGEITKADVLVGRGVIPGPKGKKKKMMEAVKAEGSWHRIAYALAEAFDDEIEKARQDSQARAMGQAAPSGGMYKNFLARKQAKAMEVARAKGIRKGASQIALGDVEAARIRQRAKEGKPVTGAEYAGYAAGRLAGAARNLIKGKPKPQSKTEPKPPPLPKGAFSKNDSSTPPEKPEPPKTSTPPEKPGPIERKKRSEENMAQRAKDREKLLALRAQGPAGRARAKQSKEARKKARQKKYNRVDAGVEYMRWGRMLAEAFGLSEGKAQRRPVEDRKKDTGTPESEIMRATKRMKRAGDAATVAKIRAAVKEKDREEERKS